MFNIVCWFLIGFLVHVCVTKYKVNEVIEQLEKVSQTGDPMFRRGIKYSISQIMKGM